MLSIIIPTYNEEEHLPRLLASIGCQSFTDFEVVVADNFSKDKTRAVAARFGARVVDGGNNPGKGRNRGAEAAKGDTFLFLDADVVLPDIYWLERKLRQFEKRKLGLATCLVKPLSDKAFDKVSHAMYNAHMLAMQYVVEHAPGFCLFARRRIHERVSGFDEGIELAEDHDYVKRGSEFARFRVLIGTPIHVSVRRFERDGRWDVIKKYLKAEIHILAKGSAKHAKIEYTWGHDDAAKNPARKGR